jgi:hypothetical protein
VIRTTHGKIHGKRIELDQDLGLADGQDVEVQVVAVPGSEAAPTPNELARIYSILGERYESGHADTSERHNEHQP